MTAWALSWCVDAHRWMSVGWNVPLPCVGLSFLSQVASGFSSQQFWGMRGRVCRRCRRCRRCLFSFFSVDPKTRFTKWHWKELEPQSPSQCGPEPDSYVSCYWWPVSHFPYWSSDFKLSLSHLNRKVHVETIWICNRLGFSDRRGHYFKVSIYGYFTLLFWWSPFQHERDMKQFLAIPRNAKSEVHYIIIIPGQAWTHGTHSTSFLIIIACHWQTLEQTFYLNQMWKQKSLCVFWLLPSTILSNRNIFSMNDLIQGDIKYVCI